MFQVVPSKFVILGLHQAPGSRNATAHTSSAPWLPVPSGWLPPPAVDFGTKNRLHLHPRIIHIYIIFTRSSQEFHRFTSTPCSTVCNFGENICSMAKLASVGAGCDDNCVSSASQDAAAATVPSSLHHSSITAHVNFANKTGAVRKQSLLSM